MARSREEARAELRNQFQKTGQKRIELDDILLQLQGNLLVRKISLLHLGDKLFWGESFEIWTDAEKYRALIPGEDGYIYCSQYAGSSEETMIRTFKQRFGIA